MRKKNTLVTGDEDNCPNCGKYLTTMRLAILLIFIAFTSVIFGVVIHEWVHVFLRYGEPFEEVCVVGYKLSTLGLRYSDFGWVWPPYTTGEFYPMLAQLTTTLVTAFGLAVVMVPNIRRAKN